MIVSLTILFKNMAYNGIAVGMISGSGNSKGANVPVMDLPYLQLTFWPRL
jgi:hypothetical protein